MSLGVCYQLGNGVERDEQRAAELFMKAALQGHPRAQYNLGVSLSGVIMDLDQAVAWISKAAEQGHGMAIEALRLCQ